MILGIGTDIVDCRRLKRPFDRFGQKFIQKILTPNEWNYIQKKTQSLEGFLPKERIDEKILLGLGKVFAAKEAFVKALGTGFRAHIHFLDMEVQRNDQGAPFIQTFERADICLQNLTLVGMQSTIQLSLSDEWPYAQAFVVISGE